jgi:ATP-dependent protease La (LON) substrate-binding domain
MHDFLPIFPLQLVSFPGEHLNLHIFEPRYRQLIKDCTSNGTTFGIPTIIEQHLSEYGTEMKLLSIEKTYIGGEMDIKTQAIGVFLIKEFYAKAPKKLYAGADIQRIPLDTTGSYDLNQQIIGKIKELFRILNIQKEIPTNTEDFYTFQVGHHVGFTIAQECDFLKIHAEKERQYYLLAHLDSVLPIAREMEQLRLRAQMNGHFKQVFPPKL